MCARVFDTSYEYECVCFRMFVWEYAFVRVCVSVCVYICVCACVCVRVCMIYNCFMIA